jgi:hypothetical protein
MRLSPRDSDLWSIQTAVALCHFVGERYDEMLRWALQAVETKRDAPFPYGTVAVAQVCLGDLEHAQVSAQRMLELEPGTSARGVGAILRSTNADIAARYISGLRRAGVPE